VSANLARVPIFMRELANDVARVLIDELQLDASRADELGLRIARAACQRRAGELIYVSKGAALDIDDRDRELYSLYYQYGKDANRVAQWFDISVKQVYERVRIVEAARQAENQGALFVPADED